MKSTRNLSLMLIMLMTVSMIYGQGRVATYPGDGKLSSISLQEVEKEENIIYSSGWTSNRTDLFQLDGIGVYPVVADEDEIDMINPGYRTRGIAAGSDLDNDGLKEVIITDYRNRGVHIYESTSDNTLEWVASVGDESTTYYTTPRHVITGDLDQNGRGEIIFLGMRDTVDANTGINVWEWDGIDGSDTYIRYVIPILIDGVEVDRYYGERSLNMGDIDGDGQVELLIALNGSDNSSDAFVIGSIQGSFSSGFYDLVVEYSNVRTVSGDFNGSPWGQPNMGDLDGDGRLEAHFFSWDHAKMLLVESTGIDTYELQSVTTLDTSYTDQTVYGTTYVTDIDNDGHDELFGGTYPEGWFWQVSGGDDVSVMGYETGKIEILSQTGVFWDVTGGDVDGDGFDELFTVEYNQARVHQWHYNGTYWEQTLLVEWPDLMGGLALDFAGDLDGDGYPELVQGFLEEPFSVGNPSGYAFAVIEYRIDIPLENSLVAHYPFNGNANDESENGNDGVENGGVTLTEDRFGTPNSAYLFDGVDDNIGLPVLMAANLEEFSVSFWASSTRSGSAFGQYDYDSYHTNHLVVAGPKAVAYDEFMPSGGQLQAQLPDSSDTWRLITLVRSGAYRAFYIDGVLTAEDMVSETYSGSAPDTATIGVRYYNGSIYNPETSSYQGKLDDVSIYNRALTAQEIKSLYHEGCWPLVPKTPVLTMANPEGIRSVMPSGQAPMEIAVVMKNDGPIDVTYDIEIVSADSTRIAFVSEPDPTTYNGNIWTMNADGSDKTQLTFDIMDRDVSWSPDGSKITFWSMRSGNADIWIMNADGSNMLQLTNDPSFDAYPDWSPDGQYLIFVSNRDISFTQIYKLRLDDLSIEQLTFTEINDSRPQYSPDGYHFVTQVRDGVNPGAIYVYSCYGAEYQNIGVPDAHDYQPAWSPDGRRVVWSSYAFSNNVDVVSANMDGSDLRLEFHSDERDWYPRYSPDGQYLAISKTTYSTGAGDEIMIWDKAFHKLYSITDHTYDVWEWGPEWSPVFTGQPQWVQADQSTGSLSIGAEATVNITLDLPKLLFGDHTASILIRNSTNGNIISIFPINIRIRDDLRPQIYYVEDVPEDQGNWVEVHWEASALDGAGEITQYGVLERNPFTDQWVSLGSTPALQRFAYTFLAHTYMNAMWDNPFESEFRIIAHTMDPEKYFASESGFGFSWDNLFPQAPTGLSTYEENDLITLNWDAPVDEDFQYFRLYRSTDENFSSEELIQETIETEYLDSGVEVGMTYYYRIAAVDFNQNEGESSEAINHYVVGIDGIALPEEFTLQHNYPNPFNPTTSIRYGIPEVAEVTLRIFDVTGREVSSLVNRSQSAGWYTVQWNGTAQDGTPVGTGVYLARMQAGDYSEVIKMVYLR